MENIEALKKENILLKEALKEYAKKENWGSEWSLESDCNCDHWNGEEKGHILAQKTLDTIKNV